VFLDADTLVLSNCDELFDREEFSAAPDAGQFTFVKGKLRYCDVPIFSF
jgi:alpha-N-acetylglucosamine transferase